MIVFWYHFFVQRKEREEERCGARASKTRRDTGGYFRAITRRGCFSFWHKNTSQLTNYAANPVYISLASHAKKLQDLENISH